MDMTPVPLAGRMGNLRSNAIRELLAITQRPDVISMAGGLPASDAFPVDEIRTVTARLLRDDPTSLLQYSTTEGFPELRAWIAEQAAASRGREVDPDQVLITHGSQQALDLVSKVFVDPGVEVAIDEPGYIGAIQALQVFEPALLPCRSTSTASTALLWSRCWLPGIGRVCSTPSSTSRTRPVRRSRSNAGCTSPSSPRSTASSSSKTIPTGRCASRASSCRRSRRGPTT